MKYCSMTVKLNYSANTVAVNIFQQVDDEGNLFSILEEISYHKKTNDAVRADDAFFFINGEHHPRRTTKGGQQKDGNFAYDGRTGQRAGKV
jgi:hypothetical protein